MTIPVLFLIMHGPIATNILNLYSCSLAALSIGLRTARWKVTAAAAVIGSGVLIIFIQDDSFATSFDNWIVSIIVWISPWAGITLVEYFVLRRGRVDVPALYEPPDRSIYGDINWPAIIALVVGPGGRLGVGVRPGRNRCRGRSRRRSGTRTSRGPPGMFVAGGLYWALASKRVRRTTPDSAAAP